MKTYKDAEFGKRLADAIDRAHLRQSEVADRCGIHRSDMSRILKGERGLNGKQLEAVAGLLGVSVESLAVGADSSVVHETEPARLGNDRGEVHTLPARVQQSRDAYLEGHQHELSLAEARWIERCTPWIDDEDGDYGEDFWHAMLSAYRAAHPRAKRS